jgi:hypothetical protein
VAGPRDRVQLDHDTATGRFAVDLAGRPPGVYELVVRALEVPGAPILITTETIEVIDGDDLT